MKRTVALSLLVLGVLVGTPLVYTESASSSSSDRHAPSRRAVAGAASLSLAFATTLTVDRADDNAAATACTSAPNDCSLRGAIIAANADAGADPVIINLQPATTYNLTLTNAAQENAAATGDLDITTSLHSVTVAGGGSSGPGATVIDAAGLNTGSARDRAFHVTGSGVEAVFQNLIIRNGKAADDGAGGASTNPAAQNSNRAGGGILNNGGGVTLTNVAVQSCQALGKGDSIVNEHTTLDALGGGIASLAATGDVIITGSTLTGNAALGGNGGNFNNGAGSNALGGAIYFEGGTLSIAGSRILLNSANGGVGGNGPGNQANGGAGGIARGGGVYVGGGTASINNSTFESCAAVGGNAGTGQNGGGGGGEGGGGGLYSLGSVTVTNSTFDLNSSDGGRGGDAFGPGCFGGHIAFDGGAARGGAILADGGSLIINTATFASNSADGGDGGDGGKTDGGVCAGTQHGAGGLAHGGAITNNNAATVNIKHATISLNHAHAGNSGVNQGGAVSPPRLAAEGAGGGIRVGSGGVTLENTIISGNTAANGAGDTTGAPTPGPNVDGAVTSNGHNLIGVATDATGFTGTGDQAGTDPLLAALADNGGATRTMALSVGSPAIDAGVAAGASFDQRWMPRTYDDPGVIDAATSDATDIGAFELQPVCSLSCLADFSVPNDVDSCGAVVNYTTPSGAACGTVTCDHPSGAFFPLGDTTVTCTSSAGPSCSFKITVKDTQNPTITAPHDASYQCASQVPAALASQAVASDNCGTPTVNVSDSTNGGAGSVASPLIITRTYTATDAAGLSASASQTITVVDDTPPVVSPPADLTADADASSCSAAINPGTATATDNCSGVSVSGARSDSQPLNAPYPVGTTTITWTATDTHGNSSSATQTVTVTDAQAPTVTNLSASPASLWPPNHTMQGVTVSYDASDNCGGVNCVIGSVTSNEPVNGTGDGDTAPDWLILDSHHVQLRAERAGGGAGRVYTITVVCTDGANHATTKTVTVNVPKSRK